jgi:type II secretory pathway component PulC
MRERRLLSWVVVVILVGPAYEQSERPNGGVTVVEAAVAMAAEPTSPGAGAAPSPPGESSTAPTAAAEPEAATDLQLLGIVRAGTPSAVIAYGGKQEIFRKGDSVFDHGTVKEIRESSVVLRAGDKDVTLKLAEAAPVAAAPPPPVEEVVPTLAAPPAPPAASEPLSRAETRVALKGFASLLGAADAKRVAVGGGHGVQLGKVDAASFLAKLGLRSGDVLQRIGDTAIDDPDHVPDLSGDAERPQLEIRFTREDVGLTVSRPIQ